MVVLSKLISLVVIAPGWGLPVFRVFVTATLLWWSLHNLVRAAAKISAGGVGSL